MSLTHQHCIPIPQNTPPLSEAECAGYMVELSDWQRVDGQSGSLKLKRIFVNYGEALAFVRKVSELAEAENHHPDIAFGWGYANLVLTTHNIGGLTLNDFIMAAKIESLTD